MEQMLQLSAKNSGSSNQRFCNGWLSVVPVITFDDPQLSVQASSEYFPIDSSPNFLNMVSKALSPSNRPQTMAFIRGEPLEAFRPVTITLDPTLDCNANCPGCIEQTPMSRAHRRSIPWARMQKLIPALHALGVRAIELYGGEPTHYPWFADLLRLICDQGLRLAIATNGSLLYRHLDVLEEVQSCLSWLRISINAGTAETHHRTFWFARQGVFRLIFDSAEYLAGKGLPTGFSYVVTRQNCSEISRCAQLCEQAGSQYLALKPFVHPDTKQLLPLPTHIRHVIKDQIAEAHAQCRDVGFQIVLTESLRLVLEAESVEDLRQPKDYPFCAASMFRAVISPLSPPGHILSCPYHRASPKHVTGTLAQFLDGAWLQSKKRSKALTACDPRVDCDFWCNRHTLNQALWEWRRRYEAGERDILNNLPVTDPPENVACWL
jgi:MoaA/NifB/PqqE/SkfB family radical SAM enzyme